MKLFYKAGACSLSPHIVLRETGMDFSLVKVDLATKQIEDGASFLDVNPKGQVPALELDDGTILTEGVAIVQYLADSVADRQLLAPVGSVKRYQTLAWLNYIATELHKGFTPLFRPDTPEDYKPLARQALEARFRYVNESLKDQAWITGQRFTVADAYLFTVLRWAQALKLDLAGLDNIAGFMQRMNERESVKAALAAEKAST